MAGNAGPTVTDVINEALGILGVYQGDPLSASDLASAFFTLQALVDGWQCEPLTFRQVSTVQFETTAGKQSYVLGPAADGVDWVTPFLPLDLREGDITQMQGTLEIPLAIDTRQQWELIAIKSMQSGILNEVWPDLGITTHTLNFWPVPSVSIPVNLYLAQQLAKPTATTAALVAPPGYQEALTFELAIKCSSKFGAAVPEWVFPAWVDAKHKIKAANFEPLDQYCDAALVKRNTRLGSIRFYVGE